jgi:integrase
MRDAELKGLQWDRLDLQNAIVTVGDSKTEAGEGRTIPLNSDALSAMVEHSKWYLKKFGETRPEWYVFPFGKPQPTDPKRGVTTFKTVWGLILKQCGIAGRWHDNRHTFVTDLAESGAGDQTIMDMAGHVSRDMLKHYSHIRMKAKREAVAALVVKPKPAHIPNEEGKELGKVERIN